MTKPPQTFTSPYVYAAWLLAVLGWVGAPMAGLMRDWLLKTFPSSALKVIVGLLLLVAVAVAVQMIRALLRGQKGHRFLWLTAATLLLGFQLTAFQTAVSSVNVVEKIHIVQYGLLAFLVARSMRQDARSTDPEASDSESTAPLSPDQLWIPALVAALAGVVDESLQGYFQLRTGDIRDVAMNALAGCMGACVAASTADWQRWDFRWNPRRLGDLACWTALLFFMAGFFFHQFHIGYRHQDPQIGVFQSWFSMDELEELSRDRLERWSTDPPTGLEAWAPQDYYLTEAAWHANHRNERLSSEDWGMALQAHRILERYYEPFLDVESFRGSGKHRWDPDLIRKVEAGAVAQSAAVNGEVFWRPETYWSPVLKSRIYVWPRAGWLLFWLGGTLAFSVWAWNAHASLRSVFPKN